jgi:hypothetical protein
MTQLVIAGLAVAAVTWPVIAGLSYLRVVELARLVIVEMALPALVDQMWLLALESPKPRDAQDAEVGVVLMVRIVRFGPVEVVGAEYLWFGQ